MMRHGQKHLSGQGYFLLKATLSGMIVAILSLWLLPTAVEACEYCNFQFAQKVKGKPWGRKMAQQYEAWRAMRLASLETSAQAPRVRPVSVPTASFASVSAPRVGSPRIPAVLPPTSYVPPGTAPNRRVKITMTQGEVAIGNGVIYKGFLIDGKVPGPTFIFDEGDVIEFTVENKGMVPHGVSIHAAYTQTSKYFGNIKPGESKKLVWRASYPGVYMYHCAPGGHAIPMHTFFGQYGMIYVRPKKPFAMEQVLGRKPDVEIFLIQHEFYASGKDAVLGGTPLYTVFNGKLFRYVEEPIRTKPGDFVRIYFLNVGPNSVATLHLVGIIWDFAYWQGHPDNLFIGGQSVIAGPTDSWIVDFRAPEDEGNYLIVTHAFGSATRGAIGILKVTRDEERTRLIKAEGPTMSDTEFAEYKKAAARIISPFDIGTPDVDSVYEARPDEKKVTVHIVGNSYSPKIIRIPVGTEVEWINEDVFTYSEGEFAGIHNVFVEEGPEKFASPLLGHAERFIYKFTRPGEYNYTCTPHPYMKGRVIVYQPEVLKSAGPGWLTYAGIGVLLLALALAGYAFITHRRG